MTPLRQTIMACSMLGWLAGCQVNNEALRAEVITAVLPDATCGYAVNNPSYSRGFYDPTVDGGQGFLVTMLLRNNMQQPDDEKIALPTQTDNINRRAHDVQVTSYDACWYFADAIDSYSAENMSGEAIDCSTIPEQSARIPALGRVDENSGMALVQTQVLELSALRSLFGTNFNPTGIPALGRSTYEDPSVNPQVANGSQDTKERFAYSFLTEDPGNLAGRSTFWGSKYPAQRNVEVVVQMRANLQLQSGEKMHSNWFTLPVTVCTGCLQDYCGPLVEETCARGPCSDGTDCLSTGLCANPALTCSAITLYSGARPDFKGQPGLRPCLPAQGFSSTTPLTCEPVGCRATN